MANPDFFNFGQMFGNFGNLGMPGMITPTMDIDELDKKIKDLKAVEGWLSMNLSMLQMTIQGLEVQRNTLSSIKAMGEAFNQSVQNAAEKRAEFSESMKAEAASESSTSHESPDTENAAQQQWPWELMAQAMKNLAPFPIPSAEQNPTTDQNAQSATDAAAEKQKTATRKARAKKTTE